MTKLPVGPQADDADAVRAKFVGVAQGAFAPAVLGHRLGNLLSFHAKVALIVTTSVSVHVDVYAERNPENFHVVKVTEADLTYVAIDSKGQPRPVPR
jgi:hypothetical protein